MLEKFHASQEMAVNELSKAKINLPTEQRLTELLTNFSSQSEKVNLTPRINLTPKESARSEDNNNAIPVSSSARIAYEFGSMDFIMKNDAPSNMDSDAFEKAKYWE